MHDPDELVRNVGRRVAELRRESDKTQADLALDLRVSVRWLQRLEQCGENLTLHTLTKLANGLQVTPQALLQPPSDEARVVQRRGRPPKRQ